MCGNKAYLWCYESNFLQVSVDRCLCSTNLRIMWHDNTLVSQLCYWGRFVAVCLAEGHDVLKFPACVARRNNHIVHVSDADYWHLTGLKDLCNLISCFDTLFQFFSCSVYMFLFSVDIEVNDFMLRKSFHCLLHVLTCKYWWQSWKSIAENCIIVNSN